VIAEQLENSARIYVSSSATPISELFPNGFLPREL